VITVTPRRRAGWNFANVVRTKTWGDPDRWQKALAGTDKREMVFTCSWSDFFLPEADQWRDAAWQIIKRCPNLTWQDPYQAAGANPSPFAEGLGAQRLPQRVARRQRRVEGLALARR
jgi:hypothetical protein